MAREQGLDGYGMLGDTRSAALVSADGGIDWLCIPRFDGDPIFGALIDSVGGGRWSIRPLDARLARRSYTDHAASIRATWRGASGTAETIDGMITDTSSALRPRMTIVRRIRCTSGRIDVETFFDPRLGLPGRPPARVRGDGHALTCTWGATAISVACDHAIDLRPGRTALLTLDEGQAATFVLGLADREPLIFLPPADGARLVDADDRWWQSWIRRFDLDVPHADQIARSLLTLRLLTYAPAGSQVAAPTTSLPAPPGSDRAWDYRYAWPRDAGIAIEAFLALGSDEEPRAFLDWFVIASRTTRPRVNVVYDLVGLPLGDEREIGELARNGEVVRIGNAAASQHQLDVYGWLLRGVWRMHDAGHRLTRQQWSAVRAFANEIASAWSRPDDGIWEERDQPRHYVHSKLMAWVGLDRALRLCEDYPARGDDVRWRAERDALAARIRERGFSETLGSYRREFDRDELDAAMLILPATAFEHDPRRVHGTIDAIRRRLGAGGALVYRNLRGGRPEEGAFVPCSFWLVQALAQTGRLDEAEEAFAELCALSSPLGLYAEQIDPSTRRPMGNFPQAFSHATMLQAAATLNRVRETSRGSSRRARVRSAPRRASARRS